jgi:hypothetical protein
MRSLFKLSFLILLIVAGGLLYIRRVFGCSWRESIGIADQFLTDLLG